jgi:hypothetical protein
MSSYLSTVGAVVGGAGMLAASVLPSTVANAVQTTSNAEKNQSTITNYVDNQSNSSYAKHNRTDMNQAWNYFNPLKYSSGSSPSTTGSGSSSGSTTSGSGVNPGGPDVTTGTGSSAATGSSGASTSGQGGATTNTQGSPTTTGTTTTPQIPSALRRIVMADATHTLQKIKAHWRSSDTNPTWMPAGTDWQSDWSNWNPVLWEQNGSTYSNWAKQLDAYLSSRFPGYAIDLKEVGL